MKGFSVCLFSTPLLQSWSSVYHQRIPPASQNCMLFFHVSLHASPANESPRKLISKSTNSAEQCSWLPADSVICWITQACHFFKCCTSVTLNGSAMLLLILIRYLILISSDLLLSVQCLSCHQKVCVRLFLLLWKEKTQLSFFSFVFHIEVFAVSLAQLRHIMFWMNKEESEPFFSAVQCLPAVHVRLWFSYFRTVRLHEGSWTTSHKMQRSWLI